MISQSQHIVEDTLQCDKEYDNFSQVDTVVHSLVPMCIDSDDDDANAIDVHKSDRPHASLATHVNTVFDVSDDHNELVSIISHQYCNGILELCVKYGDGETSWHPLSWVKDQDKQVTAQYILDNDMGKILNGIHRRWARAFLISLRHTLRRRHCTSFLGYSTMLHNPSPKKRWSRRSCHSAGKTRIADAVSFVKCRRTFKYGLEVPKSWKEIICIDTAAGNHKWQEAAAK